MVWQVARKEEDIAERDKTILPPSERDPNSKVLSRQFVNDHVNLCEAYAAPPSSRRICMCYKEDFCFCFVLFHVTSKFRPLFS